MADLEQVERAFLKADQAGDTAAAQVLANEVRRIRSIKVEPLDVNPTSGMTTRQLVQSGIGKAMTDAGRGVGQLLGLVSSDDVAESRKRDAALMDTTAGFAGNVGGNIGMALAPGGILKGAAAVAGGVPALSAAAPALSAAGSALLVPKTIGGAAALGGAQGMIQPAVDMGERGANVALGAGISAALPAAMTAYKTAKAAAQPFYQSGRDAILGDTIKAAMGGDDQAKIAIAKLLAAREIVPGSAPTAAQAGGNAGLAGLERAAISTQPTVKQEHFLRMQAQDAARLDALRGIAPIAGSRNEAAQSFGNIYDNIIPKQQAAATKNVGAAFESVDPSREAEFFLPIDQFRAASEKFLGPGTVGTGSRAAAIIAEAERIGTEKVKQEVSKAEAQTLAQAVRKAGGIKATGAGELEGLRNKGSGSSGLVTRNGQSADLMADEMHRAGFIPSSDPDMLIQALEKRGRAAIGHGSTDAEFAAMRAAATGESIPKNATIPKTVGYSEMQNIRSSAGELAEQAEAKGANKEAAALRAMIAEIDEKIVSVGSGQTVGREFAQSEFIERYRDALRLHTEKMRRFHTGPQASGFRKGGDGQASTQGAEWAPKFFNAAGSQADDVRAFHRVAGGDKALIDALKSFAVTDAVGNKNALTPAQFANWSKNKSGAIGELMGSGERQTISNINEDLQRAAFAESQGIGKGSNTVQNLAYANIMNQSGMPGLIRSLAPSQVTGALFSRASDIAYKNANEKMAEQLARALMTPAETARLAMLKPNEKLAAIAQVLSRGGGMVGAMAPAQLNASKQ